jgi:hypothetical protein
MMGVGKITSAFSIFGGLGTTDLMFFNRETDEIDEKIKRDLSETRSFSNI